MIVDLNEKEINFVVGRGFIFTVVSISILYNGCRLLLKMHPVRASLMAATLYIVSDISIQLLKNCFLCDSSGKDRDYIE